MKIRIIAIGRLRDPPFEALIERYRTRCHWPVDIQELNPKGKQTGKDAEGELLLSQLNKLEQVIALDEHGRNLTSRELASELTRIQDNGISELAIIIGGADGLAQSVRERSTSLWAFGRVTWPHMLTRLLVLEQVYRASTIIQGHPYHRD